MLHGVGVAASAPQVPADQPVPHDFSAQHENLARQLNACPEAHVLVTRIRGDKCMQTCALRSVLDTPTLSSASQLNETPGGCLSLGYGRVLQVERQRLAAMEAEFRVFVWGDFESGIRNT